MKKFILLPGFIGSLFVSNFIVMTLLLASCASSEPKAEFFPPKPPPSFHTPSAKIATQYYQNYSEQLLTEEERTLYQDVCKLFTTTGREKPQVDTRLALLGRELGKYYINRNGIPPLDFLRRAALWFGVGDYDLIALYRTSVGAIDKEKFYHSLEENIGSIDKRLTPNYAGIGVYASKERDDVVAVLVMARRYAEFQPFLKNGRPGEELKISGKLINADWRALATFSLPGKKPQALKLDVKDDGSFEIIAAFPKDIPSFSFDISAETDQARKPLAGFEIYVSAKEPDKYNYPPKEDETTLQPDVIEERFFAYVNRDRETRGLRQLEVNQAASHVVSDWAKLDAIAPDKIPAQLNERGILYFHFRTVSLKGSSFNDLYEQAIVKPTFQEVFFDPNFTQIGVGAYIMNTDTGPRISLAVLFLCAPISVDPMILRDSFMERLNDLRFQAGVPQLKYDDRLTKDLTAAIKKITDGEDPQDIRNYVREAIQKITPPIKTPATTYFTLLTLDAQLPKQIASSLKKPERDRISFAIKPITDPNSNFKGYLIYYVVFGK